MITKKLLPFLLLGMFFIQSLTYAQSLEFRKNKEGILLLEDDLPRFFYQTATKSLDGQYPRANYIHPLYGFHGEILTEDFPKDHLHHHGIFWSWHQLYAEGKRVGDPWISKGVSWEVKNSTTKVKRNIGTIKSEIDWIQTSDSKPVIKENLLVTYERLEDNVYALTFDVKLTALLEGVEIGGSEDPKGYGGFSPRFRLPEDIEFRSTTGKVEPHTNPVQAGPWMNLTGSFDAGSGMSSGIVIMGEPEKLPSYQGWILRSAKSMQNMAFPGQNAISIKKGETLQFKNQILIHKDLTPEQIQSYYEKFRAESSR